MLRHMSHVTQKQSIRISVIAIPKEGLAGLMPGKSSLQFGTTAIKNA